ncbi:TraQ conjugal transfer family protein [Elizabethkingia anophelis]|uniref:TraQ conjugal transfer family protein n=1 Tax=Elizabethkingia anophelis TaxID=1117645 RepID=UPI0013692ED3|nr:TraQ conjugal transfer family protein [Elizabethkingia anophelis]MYY43962.1 DUF3872 domain-containing protein [Elizabethkingia anophelis]
MKRFIKKVPMLWYIRLEIILPVFSVIFTAILISGCEKALDIQTDFSFELSSMPVPKKVKNSETVEIRLKIEPKGDYSGTEYKIRYFQYGGIGKLTLKDHVPFTSNDSYPLPDKDFNLYYTAISGDSHEFSIWIEDNHGHEQTLSFEF